MSRIKFDTCRGLFFGRNGVSKCHGVSIIRADSLNNDTPVVRVYPITSRNIDGRGWIEIPVAEAFKFIRAIGEEAGIYPEDLWEPLKKYPLHDWQSEVACFDTLLGYWDWVAHKQETEERSGPPVGGEEIGEGALQ
jgi:hypothetical protein